MPRRTERKTSRRTAPQSKTAHRPKGAARDPVSERSLRGQRTAARRRKGVPIKGVTSITFTSDRVRLRLAEQRRAAAQLISVMDRRSRLERLVEDAASAAQRYPGLDLHISEWPSELIGTMPQPAGTRADIHGCHAHVGVVEWFSPGREVWRTLRSRSSQIDELTLGFAELQSLLPRLSDIINTVPIEAFVDPVNWWLLKLHVWVKPPLSVWAGGAEFSADTVRANLAGQCLSSSIQGIHRVLRDLIEQMRLGTESGIWRQLLIPPPALSDEASDDRVRMGPISLSCMCGRMVKGFHPKKLRKWIAAQDIGYEPVSPRRGWFTLPRTLLRAREEWDDVVDARLQKQ